MVRLVGFCFETLVFDLNHTNCFKNGILWCANHWGCAELPQQLWMMQSPQDKGIWYSMNFRRKASWVDPWVWSRRRRIWTRQHRRPVRSGGKSVLNHKIKLRTNHQPKYGHYLTLEEYLRKKLGKTAFSPAKQLYWFGHPLIKLLSYFKEQLPMLKHRWYSLQLLVSTCPWTDRMIESYWSRRRWYWVNSRPSYTVFS